MFIFVSKIINIKFKKKYLYYAILGIFCLWYAFSSLSIHPHYLEYFNEIITPENGYQYFLGSNLDWGQDFKLLSEYIKENNISHLYLKTYSCDSPEYRGVNITRLECNQKVEGIIAIDANALQGLVERERGCFSWLKEHEPIDRVAYTYFIFES